MGGSATVLVELAAVAVTALCTWLIASRKQSGRIGTSDADRLWDASEAMRTETRTDLGEANKRIVALEARVAELEKANVALIRENVTLLVQVEGLKKKVEGDS